MFPSTTAMLDMQELYFPFNKLAEQDTTRTLWSGMPSEVTANRLTSGWHTQPVPTRTHVACRTQQLQDTLPGSCQHPLSQPALLCPPITFPQPLPTLRVPQQLQLLHTHPEFQGYLSLWHGCPQLQHPWSVQMCLVHQGWEIAFEQISNLAELCSFGMNSQGWIFGKFFAFVNSVSVWV